MMRFVSQSLSVARASAALPAGHRKMNAVQRICIKRCPLFVRNNIKQGGCQFVDDIRK